MSGTEDLQDNSLLPIIMIKTNGLTSDNHVRAVIEPRITSSYKLTTDKGTHQKDYYYHFNLANHKSLSKIYI